MTVHNIDKYHKCTEAQIFTDLSPETDGVFAYAIDTGELYVSHNGGWIITSINTGVKNYEYAGVQINPLVHLDASAANTLKTKDNTNATNREIIHEWKDLTSRNDVMSHVTFGPTLSADAINGNPGIDFKRLNQTAGKRGDYANSEFPRQAPLISRARRSQPLESITCMIVAYMPDQFPWGEKPAGVIANTGGISSAWPSPLINTQSANPALGSTGFMMAYERSTEILDRFWTGSGGAYYNSGPGYDDIAVNEMTSEERMAPKILWFTASYNCPEHSGFAYQGINGAMSMRVQSGRTKRHPQRPDMSVVAVGYDTHSVIGEILLCEQSMDATDLNKLGQHLSAKWNIPWYELPDYK